MAKEYKENTWDPKHKAALAEATKMLHSFETANLNPVGVEKLAKEDLEMQIEMLNSLEKKYNNAGPCLDCIVFHDGQKWRFAFFVYLDRSDLIQHRFFVAGPVWTQHLKEIYPAAKCWESTGKLWTLEHSHNQISCLTR